jgi:predicted Rossmann fold flavoprotein
MVFTFVANALFITQKCKMAIKGYDIVVVGAGPAGLLAAGKAAEEGARVLLIEKMEKPARKLRITGKGRCNITNTKPVDEFMQDIFPEPRFLRDAFNGFFSSDIIELLNQLGVDTVEERGMRVFPASGKAWDVADALVKWVKSKGVQIQCFAKVDRFEIRDGQVKGIHYFDTERKSECYISCNAIVMATGGKSYPATGSTGDGYKLAEECGHTITPLLPTLVGFETTPVIGISKSLTLKNAILSLWVEGKKVDEEFGDLDIMEYGLSGPIVLRLSRKIIQVLAKDSTFELICDLKPALSHQKLDARLLREVEENPRIAIIDLARRLLPKELALEMVDSLGLAAQKIISRLSADERKSIRLWLKELKFTVVRSRSWDEAIITLGGVSLKEVNPKTMESRVVKGLFFAGELLDLDGSTGGYNLQIAYSTGWLAGKSSANLYVS